jgi:hypothetical protein
LPVPSVSCTEPPASDGVSPFRVSGNTHDVPADAELRVSDSLIPSAAAVSVTSTPGSAPRYVTDAPDTVPVTFPAPASENDTCCDPSAFPADTSELSPAAAAKLAATEFAFSRHRPPGACARVSSIGAHAPEAVW